MSITATDLQIVTLKHRLQVAREQLIKLRSVAQIVGDSDLVSETNKVIDGAWHTLNFEMPELPSDLESRIEHQNPYKHGCNPALPLQDTSLDRLLMMFSDVVDKWIASDCSPLAISALQFAIGAVRDEQFRQESYALGADDIQHLKTIRGYLEIVREILSKSTIDATFGEEAIASSIGWLSAYLGELTTDEWDENYNAMVEAVNEGRP